MTIEIIFPKFYEVTVDYLLGRSQTKNHPNADLADLRLSDDNTVHIDFKVSHQPGEIRVCRQLTQEGIIHPHIRTIFSASRRTTRWKISCRPPRKLPAQTATRSKRLWRLSVSG